MNPEQPARFEAVSKSYRRGTGAGSLREAIATLGGRGRDAGDMFWALKEVSFGVNAGETLGIIGPNGAGKTTILRLLSRITRPTSGHVHVDGRVAALIELGAGFHPDLTGRENVFLNAAILGLSQRETRARFDAIVAFSGLEAFIDTPVKRYSSGMYVRLGFAVAAHIDAGVLLVDEVLAVGDADFRQRCLERIRELQRSGMAIVFVSHNHYLVEAVCDRCVFLADGQVQVDGDTAAALDAYEAWRHQRLSEPGQAAQDDGAAVAITRVEVAGGHGRDAALTSTGSADIRIHYRTRRPIRNPNVYLKILQRDGIPCCMVRTHDLGLTLPDLDGSGHVTIRMDPLQLAPGAYMADAEILEDQDFVVLAARHSGWFTVAGSRVGQEGVFVPYVTGAEVTSDASSR